MSTGDTTSEQQKSSIPNESSEGTETLEGLAQSDPKMPGEKRIWIILIRK